jgi:hypothetical protein
MSNLTDKGPEPAELASLQRAIAAREAAITLLDPSALAELEPRDFLVLYKAVTDFRWNDPQKNLAVEDGRDPDDLLALQNEDDPDRDYPLTLDGNR